MTTLKDLLEGEVLPFKGEGEPGEYDNGDVRLDRAGHHIEEMRHHHEQAKKHHVAAQGTLIAKDLEGTKRHQRKVEWHVGMGDAHAALAQRYQDGPPK